MAESLSPSYIPSILKPILFRGIVQPKQNRVVARARGLFLQHLLAGVGANMMSLRSKHFQMAQSRSRIYILMIKKELADVGQIRGLLHLITNVLPSQIHTEATVKEARNYVKEVTSLFNTGVSVPACSKDHAMGRFFS